MTRRRRRIRTVGPVFAVVVLAFLSVKIVRPHTYAEPAGGFSDRPFGPFAGYVRVGPVTSVSATFTVPRVASGSPLGVAATWIGAQWLGAPGRFVQIGVNEGRVQLHSGKVVVAYYAFWSDVGHHFRAQPLFPAHAGDSLSAALTLAHKHWLLALTDNTSGRKARFSIGSETRGPFDLAEWLQEDPGAENNHVEYPRLTVPTFRRLTVNAAEPPPGSPNVFSQWMSANFGTLGTTSLHDDSFTLKREPPVGALAARYLRLTAAARIAANSLGRELSNWTARTPYGRIRNATSRYVKATREADHALLATRWPRQIQELVRALVQARAVLLAKARPPAAITAATFARWSSVLSEASERARRVARPLLLMLGLPTYL
jgi:hypothetical protein